MTTNAYFNHYSARNEQNLIENLIIESIQVQGMDVAYIPRTQDNIDPVFDEDPTNTFSSYKTIEMWPASVEGMDGGELMTLFGSEFKKTAHFIVSKKRFALEFPDIGEPKEGDLLFMPYTNTVLQINFVQNDSPYYEAGKQFVFDLTVEAYQYSYENIQTGNQNIDKQLEFMKIDDPANVMEDYGKNVGIEEDVEDTIDFDPANPFGVK